MRTGFDVDGRSDISFVMSETRCTKPEGWGNHLVLDRLIDGSEGATTEGGVAKMVCYEFYLRNKAEGDKLIGILPERRNKPERTDLESIMKWASMVFGNSVNLDSVYFVIVSCWEDGDGDASRRQEILAVDRHFLNQGDRKD